MSCNIKFPLCNINFNFDVNNYDDSNKHINQIKFLNYITNELDIFVNNILLNCNIKLLLDAIIYYNPDNILYSLLSEIKFYTCSLSSYESYNNLSLFIISNNIDNIIDLYQYVDINDIEMFERILLKSLLYLYYFNPIKDEMKHLTLKEYKLLYNQWSYNNNYYASKYNVCYYNRMKYYIPKYMNKQLFDLYFNKLFNFKYTTTASLQNKYINSLFTSNNLFNLTSLFNVDNKIKRPYNDIIDLNNKVIIDVSIDEIYTKFKKIKL